MHGADTSNLLHPSSKPTQEAAEAITISGVPGPRVFKLYIKNLRVRCTPNQISNSHSIRSRRDRGGQREIDQDEPEAPESPEEVFDPSPER